MRGVKMFFPASMIKKTMVTSINFIRQDRNSKQQLNSDQCFTVYTNLNKDLNRKNKYMNL